MHNRDRQHVPYRRSMALQISPDFNHMPRKLAQYRTGDKKIKTHLL